MTDDQFTRPEDKRFTLRINRDIFDKVQQEAKLQRRSVGRQIEFILAEHFRNKKKQ